VIHIWDIKEGKKRNEISGAESDVVDLLATEKFLFAASANHVRQYKKSDRKLVRTFSDHNTPIFALSYDPKTDQLAAAAFDGTVKIWDTKNGSLVSSFIAAPLTSAK
jgi:WD40 repeat protein